MTIPGLLRARKSVRHYSHDQISHSLLQELIEEASWAPSAGNMQPWQVAILNGEASRQFREKYEDLGWESVLPSLRVAMQSHAEAQRSAPHVLNQQVMDTFRQQIKVTGNPAIIAIYYEQQTIKEFIQLALAAGSLFLYRMKAIRSPLRKGIAFVQWLLRSRRDYRVAQAALQASLANFSYAITLAAKHRNLDSCIQFSYNHAYPWLRRSLQLSRSQRLFCVVLVGVARDEIIIESVQSSTRRPVTIHNIDSL